MLVVLVRTLPPLRKMELFKYQPIESLSQHCLTPKMLRIRKNLMRGNSIHIKIGLGLNLNFIFNRLLLYLFVNSLLCRILVIKCLAYCDEPFLANIVCRSTVNVDTYAGVTSKSKNVGHAGQPVAADSDVTKLDDSLPSKPTVEENNTNTKCKHVVHIFQFLCSLHRFLKLMKISPSCY